MFNMLVQEVRESPQSVRRNPTPHRDNLYRKFQKKITHNPDLDRTLVSFQANKLTPFYSWFKYKEGFSQRLVEYLLENLWKQNPGTLLDPFAGAGAAIFASRSLGWKANGIEVLPVGMYAMRARLAADRIHVPNFRKLVDSLASIDFASHFDQRYAFRHIPITKEAFPPVQEQKLIGFISYCNLHVKEEASKTLLLYASFSILEEISYTRKDGQYLRWDFRSGRSQGKKQFNKGHVSSFDEAIKRKLAIMIADLNGGSPQEKLFHDDQPNPRSGDEPNLYSGSCLEILPKIPDSSIDFVLTSPPYANRYDYTRTYALELVYLGCDQEDVKSLRQNMLSCTVENRDKRKQLEQYYVGLGRQEDYLFVNRTFEKQAALQEVLNVLDGYRDEGSLNNQNIARLVRNYFYEMSFVIFEISRVMRKGGAVAMINDNVRYAGEEVPVDLILSDIAESFGLSASHIWTLGRGKGNSSQQMGSHGRSELRKCIYVWQKP